MLVTCQPQNPECPQCGNSLPKHKCEDVSQQGYPPNTQTPRQSGSSAPQELSTQPAHPSTLSPQANKNFTASEQPRLSQKSHGMGLRVPRDLHAVGQKMKLHVQRHLYLCLIFA